MALARKFQILAGQSGFYHCYTRCVRRAFLCGQDPLTGQDFSHRRQWIVDRLALLGQAFAIDVYAYTVMSNHCHVVLFVDPERVFDWSDEEVIARWRSLYRWRAPDREPSLPTPEEVGAEILALWRERLGSISWFMKSLNEPLARLANAEDGCKGHFWQSRFKCTALLDDPAVLAAMAYVDLNPLKARLADSLADSDFTSIQHRLQALAATRPAESATVLPENTAESTSSPAADKPIAAVFSTLISSPVTAPATTLQSYIAMLEAAAAEITQRNTLSRVEHRSSQFIPAPQWLRAVQEFEHLYRRAAGSIEAIDRYITRLGRQRRVDLTGARLLSACRWIE